MFVGDLNVNMVNEPHCLTDTLHIHGYRNIMKQPTCHKGKQSTLIDVVLSNVANRLQGVLTFDTGLSDHHDMVCFASKVHVPKKTIIYNLQIFQ